LIICTDSDCFFEPDRIKTIAAYFKSHKLKFLASPIAYDNNIEKSTLYTFLILELKALVGTGGATLSFKWPTMCNGANMAFSKKAFIEVGGFSNNLKTASGDDEFLMRSIFSKYREGVKFIWDKKALVYTAPPNSLDDFYQQRIRWAGKWENQNDLKTQLLALFIWLSATLAVYAQISLIFNGLNNKASLIFILTRAILNYIFLNRVSLYLGNGISLQSFCWIELVYPWYVVYFGLLSRFKKAKWKNRILIS
jgi:cellulose synthase/poly-beta-1,6-N-acetylglucosamine synthase-like glycosyltransferase